MCSLVLGQILTLFSVSLSSERTLSKKRAHSIFSPFGSIRLLPNPLLAYKLQPFLPRNLLLFDYPKIVATASSQKFVTNY